MENFMLFTILLGIFAVLGLLFGLARGLRKSIFRLGVVILSAVLAVVFSGTLTHTILSTPIADFPFDVTVYIPSNVTASPDASVQDVLVQMLTENATVKQLTDALPTLTNFLLQAPQAIISAILFILLFFLIKFVLWFPEAILSAIFLRKKGDHLLGGLVGAVQGIFCACVVLVPVFGFMTLADTAVHTASASSSVPAGSVEEQILTFNEQYYAPIKKDPVYSILEKTGVQNICTEVFYHITEGEDAEGNSISFFQDLNSSIPSILGILRLSNIDFSQMSLADITAIRSITENLANAPLIADTLYEFVTNFSGTLLRGEQFMGISLPENLDEKTETFFRDILTALSDVEKEDMIADLPHVVDFMAVLVEYDALDAMSSSGGNADALMELFGNEEFTTDLLNAMTNSTLLSPISVSLLNNMGTSTIATALKVPQTNEDAYDLMLTTLTQELGKYSGLQIDSSASLMASPDAEEAKEAVSAVLLRYAENLSKADADSVATELLRTFCTEGANVTATETSVQSVLQNMPVPALHPQTYRAAIPLREDLMVQNEHIFNEMEDSERQAEVRTLSAILSTGIRLAGKMEDGFSDLMSQLDILPDIGALLNKMSDSRLLADTARGVMLHFLNTDSVREVMADKAIDTIQSKMEDGSIDYAATFSSIAAAYQMAQALNKTPTPDATPEQIKQNLTNAVENLFTSMDETTAEIIKDAVDDRFLEEIGVPEEVSGTAEAVLTTFFDEVVKASKEEGMDYEKEGQAIETIFEFVTSSASSDHLPESVVSDTMVDTILSSNTITNTLISVSTNPDVTLDIVSQFSDEDRTAAASVLENYEDKVSDNEKALQCLNAIRSMLGIAD